jgi:hypothetical protein
MPPAGYPPTLSPDNDPTFQNYFMGAPPIVDPYEYVFGITDVVSGTGSSTAAPVLTITTIPEPGGFMLIVLGLILAARRGRR